MSSTILSVIQHYQRSIEHSQDDEGRLLHCINKLYRLPVKVEHLQETGVGKTVNALRKYNGEIGVAAKALVTKWKTMVAAEEEPAEANNCQNDRDTDGGDDDASNGSGQNSSDDDHCNTNSHNNQNKNTDRENRRTNTTTSENISKDRQTGHHHHHHSNKEHKSKSHREDKTNKNTNEHSSSSKHRRHAEHEQNAISTEKRKKHDEHDNDDDDGEIKKHENHRHKSSHEKMEKLKTSSRDAKTTSSQSTHHKKDDAGDSHGKKESRPRDEKRSEHHSSSSRPQSNHNSEPISKHGESEKNNSPKEKDGKERSKESKHEKSKSSSKETSHRDKHHKSSSSNSKPSSSSKSAEQPSTSTSNTKLDSTNNGSSSNSKRKRHHDSDSNDASPSKTKVAKTNKTTINDDESEIDVNDGIDSSMGANFEDVLGMLNMPTKKSKKSLSNNKSPTVNTPKKNASTEKTSSSSSSSNKDNKNEYKPSSTTSTASSSKPIDMKPELLASSTKLAPLDPSIALELPTISANYKPLPTNKTVMECVYRNSGIVNNTPKPFVRTLTDAEAITHGISSKTMRTKIYSGIRTGQVFQVTSLFDLCIRILQKNIDALEYTGGVPFEVLRPVLERATPHQLLTFEEYNPYLMEDSDCLWQIHVQRSFRTKKREEMESWREMFLRCEDEKERKLSSLTETIKKSQKIIAAPVRKTQLAFVDSMVKPPRNVLRKQEQFGTREKLVATPAARVAALSNVTPNAGKVGDTRLRVAATVRDTAQATAAPARSKKAPLMVKTLQFIRGRHKR